jgi:hypothetical protein
LKKLLNLALLYKAGSKISKLAQLSDKELQAQVLQQFSHASDKDQFIDSLKVAMLSYDQSLFERSYSKMLAETPFRSIFLEVFVPLLQQIGLEWQSNGITPAHEHFISNLIKQKLLINIERVGGASSQEDETVYVLYLPLNEIHEFGLLYIHYELVLNGHHSIYLGQSVPTESLQSLKSNFKKIHYISYFTVRPTEDQVIPYLEKVDKSCLQETDNKLSVLGRNTIDLTLPANLSSVKVFNGIDDLINKII